MGSHRSRCILLSSCRPPSFTYSSLYWFGPSQKFFFPPVLWPLLTSARSARLSLYGRGYPSRSVPRRPPLVRATTFIPSTCRIYIHEPGQYWISSCLADSSIHACLVCGSCSSGRDFARRVYILPPTSGFLQIPSRGGHPCLRLTLPTAKRVADSHRQVVAHAGRTQKEALCRKWHNASLIMGSARSAR